MVFRPPHVRSPHVRPPHREDDKLRHRVAPELLLGLAAMDLHRLWSPILLSPIQTLRDCIYGEAPAHHLKDLQLPLGKVSCSISSFSQVRPQLPAVSAVLATVVLPTAALATVSFAAVGW